MSQYFSQKELLKMPISRAAFSDRMAYVMAEMSKLAYFKFEGGHTSDEFLEQTKQFINQKDSLKMKSLCEKFIPYRPPEDSKNAFSNILKENGYTLVEVFNNNGTQGFLCKHEGHKIAVLAFRGTEAEYEDIKSDINAKLTEVDINGDKFLIHSGFWKAFDSVKDSIKKNLEQIKDYQLFFTGHSLGGALATIAVRYFSSDGSGACYTFGAPPVGTKKLEDKLKTPIYRIVNNMDVVPHMPNLFTACLFKFSYKIFIWILTLSKIKIFFPKEWQKSIEVMIRESFLYRHIGYKSVLIGTEETPKLRYNLGIIGSFKRYKWVMHPKRLFGKGKRFFTDHKMEAYSKKLQKWAMNRQDIHEEPLIEQNQKLFNEGIHKESFAKGEEGEKPPVSGKTEQNKDRDIEI